MKKKLKIIIPVVIILILVAGGIVITNLSNKDKTDINTEGVIAEADATEDDEKETSSTNASTTENKTDADTEQTTNTTNATTSATTESATERPTTERPAATTEAPASSHTHNWVKVVDRAAYDEPVYTEKPVYEERPVYETQTTYVTHWTWPDGTEAGPSFSSAGAKADWCWQHCTRCFPNCPDPDPQGRCALTIGSWCEEVTTQVQTGTEKVQVGTEKVQTGTKHHDEEYHYECSECGARK